MSEINGGKASLGRLGRGPPQLSGQQLEQVHVPSNGLQDWHIRAGSCLLVRLPQQLQRPR